MLLSLFIFRGHLTRELASIVCDVEQGELLWIHTGICVGYSQHRLGRGFATTTTTTKNEGEWPGKVEISKEEIPGSRRSMFGYILTYSRFYWEKL